MAQHNSNDFSSPQEAIEGYLDALLQEVADYDEPEEELVSGIVPDKSSDSLSPSSEALFAESIPAAPTLGETRIFSPSGQEDNRENFQPQRQIKSKPDVEHSIEVAFKETPAVVMPELQVAEPEIETEVVFEEETFEEVVEEHIAESEIAEPEVVAAVEEIELQQVVIDEPIVDTVIEENTETLVEEEVKLQPQENEGWTNSRPNWAQERFECLLFVVKGLKLAVPLAELGGIHKQEKIPTPLFGQPSWFLGILRNNRMNIGLVDTAQWVMPEYINGDHSTDYRFAIHIHNSEWGLACDEVAEAISLDPEEVKWRTKLGRRPWLAGTVVDHMCALIDVAAFARLLDSDKVPVDLQALDADDE